MGDFLLEGKIKREYNPVLSVGGDAQQAAWRIGRYSGDFFKLRLLHQLVFHDFTRRTYALPALIANRDKLP